MAPSSVRVSFVGQGNGSTTLGNAVLDAYASDLGEFASNAGSVGPTSPAPNTVGNNDGLVTLI